MNDSLTPGQEAVLRAFHEFGNMTDVALAVYIHHVGDVRMSSSGVRTRRKELERKKLVGFTGKYRKLPSGRNAMVHGLTGVGQQHALALFKGTVVV